MSVFEDVAAVMAVLVLVLVRQFRPRPLDTRRFWVLPGILVVLAYTHGPLLDAHHRVLSGAILAGMTLVALLGGVCWGRTVHTWRTEDGRTWTRGTRASLAVWAGVAAARAALAGTAHLLDVHMNTGSLLLSLAGMLLGRTGALALRERPPHPPRGETRYLA